ERQQHGPAVDLARVDVGLADADGGQLGVGEDVRGDVGELEGTHGLAEGVPHRDASLHGGDGGEGVDAGDVARGVDAGDVGARDLVDGDEAAVVDGDPVLLESETAGVRDGADADEGVAAFDDGAVVEFDFDAVRGAAGRGGPGMIPDVHAALLEDLADDFGGLGVLVGHDAVPRGDEGDRRAHGEVGGGELGAGDAGADHDEVLGEFVEVVELAPGEDALAVGGRRGEVAGRGPGAQQDDVAVGVVGLAFEGGDAELVDVVVAGLQSECRTPVDDVDAGGDDLLGDVGGLLGGQAPDSTVDGLGVDGGVDGADAHRSEESRGGHG